MNYINKYSKKIKKWWTNIDIENVFPNHFQTYLDEEKKIFTVKCLYLIKNIFEIEDINNINIIHFDDYDDNVLINNTNKYKDFIKSLFDDNTQYNKEFKKHLKYILSFYNYFNDIKHKIINVIKPLFEEEHFDKLFNCDDDLTRLLPIFALILYLYILEEDIEKTIIQFLNIDMTFIQFFIISYLIIDNLMDNIDNENENEKHKKIFFKWFKQLIDLPNNKNNFELNELESNIWQCVVFRKYFSKLIEQYPYEQYIEIYKYLKDMVELILKSDKLQKNENISEDKIIEESFKKSYSVFHFIIIVTHAQLKLKFNENKIYKLCKLAFLVQMYDDLFDIKKDTFEGNYTYFNSNNVNIDFDKRIKKTFSALFVLINELAVNNKHIFEFCNFFYKNMIFLICYFLKDSINDNDFIKYTENYSFFSHNILQFFDDTSYDNLNNKKLINLIKKNC